MADVIWIGVDAGKVAHHATSVVLVDKCACYENLTGFPEVKAGYDEFLDAESCQLYLFVDGVDGIEPFF